MCELRSVITHVLLLLSLCHALPAAASGGPPMLTDDPGTPGDGHVEINLATLYNHTVAGNSWQLPLVDINYGVGERAQLKFEMPWLLQQGSDGRALRGAGSALAGVKWRFYDAGEHDWQIATYPQVQFNFPRSDSTPGGLVAPGTSYLLPLEFMRGFDGFDINFDLGRWLRPPQQADSWIAGFAFTHELGTGLEWIAELHEEFAVHQAQNELILNLGGRWDVSARYTLLFSAGRDVHNSLGPSNTLLGYLALQIHY